MFAREGVRSLGVKAARSARGEQPTGGVGWGGRSAGGRLRGAPRGGMGPGPPQAALWTGAQEPPPVTC